VRFLAFLFFRPAREHGIPALLAEVQCSRLAALPAQSDRVRILLSHSRFSQQDRDAKVFYPEGLVYSAERGYFEPANRRLFLQLGALFADELEIGVPDGI
jgi:hypothetical protein